ncbi:MAG: hypothetical protein Harvfovirus2_53 [Harvfovirus sp.]|uniref:Uncharacterized protein n=1 Tax=Harvfovirus sp. TaxID=2487768 RepID=A0A3G5A3W6_9VIRU|nr:MAG: hypothetical protein Harvfovirus2_53 [Harvfovirus sp.]
MASHNCLDWLNHCLKTRYGRWYSSTNVSLVESRFKQHCEKNNHNLGDIELVELCIANYNFFDGNGFVNILDAMEILSFGEMIQLKSFFSEYMYSFGLAAKLFALSGKNNTVIDVMIQIMKHDAFRFNHYREFESDSSTAINREEIITMAISDIFNRKIENVSEYVTNLTSMMGDRFINFFYTAPQWSTICSLLDKSEFNRCCIFLRSFIHRETTPLMIKNIYEQLRRLSRLVLSDFTLYAKAAFHHELLPDEINIMFHDLARMDQQARIFILLQLDNILLYNRKTKIEYFANYQILMNICRIISTEKNKYLLANMKPRSKL